MFFKTQKQYKHKAKQLLLKNFIEDKEYKILLLNHQQQKNNVNTTEKSKVLLPQQGEQKMRKICQLKKIKTKYIMAFSGEL